MDLIKLRRRCTVTATGEILEALDSPKKLSAAIASTAEIAPDRPVKGKTFALWEHEVPVPTDKLECMNMHPNKNGERILEAKLINEQPESNAWASLVAWQVPLYDAQEREGWGAVDLLGLNEQRFPIIVELKVGNNHGCTPLAALLEALSYAVVVTERWGKLSEELCRVPEIMPARVVLNKVGLVILAPQAYWTHWQKSRGKFAAHINGFNTLLNRLRENGFTINLCCLDSESKPTCIRSRKTLPSSNANPLGFNQWENG